MFRYRSVTDDQSCTTSTLIQFLGAWLVALLFAAIDFLVARTIEDQAFRYFAYLHALLLLVASLSLVGYGALQFRHLKSLLREAEAELTKREVEAFEPSRSKLAHPLRLPRPKTSLLRLSPR